MKLPETKGAYLAKRQVSKLISKETKLKEASVVSLGTITTNLKIILML